jgi:hypothetical protein
MRKRFRRKCLAVFVGHLPEQERQMTDGVRHDRGDTGTDLFRVTW